MTVESSVAALTASTTTLVNAVGTQQTSVTNAIAAFNAVTNRVNNELNNVNNTADANKPISTAGQQALNLKQATLVSGQNISTVNGQSLLGGGPLVIERSATSLHKITYNDRGTLRTLPAALDDATVIEGLGLFMWTNTQEEPDDDETCFTTSAGQWLLHIPAWDLLNAWDLHDASYTEDWREDEAARFAAFLLANK